MKKVSLVAGLIMAICLVYGGFSFAGTDGTYAIKQQTPMGELDATLSVNADGSGYFEDMMGKNDFTGGKIDGNNIEIKFTAQTPMGAMEMNLKGTVDGDKISGTCANDMGEFPFTGQRK